MLFRSDEGVQVEEPEGGTVELPAAGGTEVADEAAPEDPVVVVDDQGAQDVAVEDGGQIAVVPVDVEEPVVAEEPVAPQIDVVDDAGEPDVTVNPVDGIDVGNEDQGVGVTPDDVVDAVDENLAGAGGVQAPEQAEEVPQDQVDAAQDALPADPEPGPLPDPEDPIENVDAVDPADIPAGDGGDPATAEELLAALGVDAGAGGDGGDGGAPAGDGGGDAGAPAGDGGGDAEIGRAHV